MHPLPGYWPVYSMSDIAKVPEFTACLYKLACTGNWSALCIDGYMGPLCSICAVNYGRNTQYQCQSCPSNVSQILILFFGFFGVSTFICVLSIMTWSERDEPDEMHSALVKVLLSALQLNSIATQFSFEWPNLLQNFWNSQQYVGNSGTAWLNMDCFFKETNMIISPFYATTLFLAVLPLFFFIGPYCWLCLYEYYTSHYFRSETKKNNLHNVNHQPPGMSFTPTTQTTNIEEKKTHQTDAQNVHTKSRTQRWTEAEFRQRYEMIKVMGLFMVHPDITLQTFKMFACVSLSNYNNTQLYLLADLQQSCYENNHWNWIMLLAIPCLVCWVFSIPLSALLLLRREVITGRGLRLKTLSKSRFGSIRSLAQVGKTGTERETESETELATVKNSRHTRSTIVFSGSPISITKHHTDLHNNKKNKSHQSYQSDAHKDHLDRVAEQQKLKEGQRVLKWLRANSSMSFIFKGYTASHWYWEFVIIARKMFIVAVTVFSTNHFQTQSLLALLVITISTCCFVLFYFVLFCFVLFCFVLFFFVLFCFFLDCFVLYCIVLFLCYVFFLIDFSFCACFLNIFC
jgi:hypothetical protein